MTSTFRAGLLAGFIAGAGATGLAVLVLLFLRPTPSPPEARPRPPGSPDPSVGLQEENRKLARRVEELEKSRSIPPPTPAKAEKADPETPPPAQVGELFSKLTELGLSGFRSPKFAEALEAVKKGGKASIEYLSKVLGTSTSATERFYAAALLEGAADAAGLPSLVAALKGDSDDLVRRMASHALAVLGAPEGAGPLREAATGDADWGVRVNSAYGLAKLNQDDGLKILQEAYESSATPAEYRLAVLGGLADVAAPSTAPLFRKILTDTQDVSYLLASIGALEKMKDTEALPALENLSGSSSSQIVRQAALKAIGTIKN
ncbi:MAG TPA: HEAT repeat domain-containing protein [Planctomycetota bacterium]|nr:HEAT repeat domain-containing protein [Planctomycetota bacterium]